MPTALSLENIGEFLLSLDQEELRSIQSQVEGLVEDLHSRHRAESGKRPHMAMPERRLGDRYSISLVGKAHNAMEKKRDATGGNPVRILDLSRSGCGVISSALFYPGQILDLAFKTPGGRPRRVYVEVVRARECSLPGQTIYEMGCRLVNEDTIRHVREQMKWMRSTGELFSDLASVRIVQLATGKGSRNLSKHLENKGYDLTRVSSGPAIAQALEERPAEVAILPPDALKGRRPAWFTRLRRERPQTAVVALSSDPREALRLQEAGIEQTLDVGEIESGIDQAIRCALFVKLPWIERHVSQYPVKVLLAGPSERQLRRSETLLLQEKCLVAKARNYARALRELQLQRFQVLLFSDQLLEGESWEPLETVRDEHADLVVILETENANRAAQSLEHGVDMVLSPTANRAQLTDAIDRAYHLALMRVFAL